MDISGLAHQARCTLRALVAAGAPIRLDTVDDLIQATRCLVILGLLVTGHTDDGLYLEASIPGMRLRAVRNLFFGRVTAARGDVHVFNDPFYDCLVCVEGQEVSTYDLKRTKLPSWQRVSYDRPPAEAEAEARERLQRAIPHLRLWAWQRLLSKPLYAVLLLCATAWTRPRGQAEADRRCAR